MDSKEPEIKKPEEIDDALIPEEQLEKVVGGGAVKGTHIAKLTVELARNGGDQAKE